MGVEDSAPRVALAVRSVPSDGEDWGASRDAFARRLEHERSSKNRRRSLVAAEADTKPDEPDDASLKKEWLRRRRAEHETALNQRRSSSAVDDSAPLVDASLLEMPTERELYLARDYTIRASSKRYQAV